MKQAKLFLTILVVLATMSFGDKNPAEKVKKGTYGACGCGETSSTKMELILNEDFTFHYFDNYNPSKIIDVKGNWSLNENTIILKDYKSDIVINNKWEMDANEKCLKSRKGLAFTRICHLKSCN